MNILKLNKELNRISKENDFLKNFTSLVKESLSLENLMISFKFDNSFVKISYKEKYERTKVYENQLEFLNFNNEGYEIKSNNIKKVIRANNEICGFISMNKEEIEKTPDIFDIFELIATYFERYYLMTLCKFSNITSTAMNFLGSMPFPIVIMDEKFNFVVQNASFTKLLSTHYKINTLEKFKRTVVNKVVIEEAIDTLKEKDLWTGVIWIKRMDGSIFPQEVTFFFSSKTNKERYFFIFFSNLTIQNKVEEELDYFANYDFLTTLPNRKGFNEKISFLLEEKIPFSLAILDIDGFKFINEHYGHPLGDELLVVFSKLLRQVLPKELYKCRLSGDEFIILFEGEGSHERIDSIFEDLFLQLKNPLDINNTQFPITISSGISSYPKYGNDLSSIISSADYALFKAKENDGNSYIIYDEDLHHKHKKKTAIIHNLKDSVENREFLMYYQPILDSKGKVLRVEALIRWIDKNNNMISPFFFIPIAEETGLITKISKEVGRLVLNDLKELKKEGFEDIKISVNISLKDFEESYLKKESILDIFCQNKGISKNITLEVTESLFMKERIDYLKQLTELREYGFEIALDDFGTGYSSLSYLTKLPIDTIKIDKSFILSLNDKKSSELVKIIIHMAKVLGLKVVAEGVEELFHFDFLKELECEYFQGYYFSKPMCLEDTIDFLKVNKSIS